MIRVFGDWELIEENYSKDDTNRTTSLYRCKKCGEDKILRKSHFKKCKDSRCPSCEKIYNDSIIGMKVGRLTVISRSDKLDKNGKQRYYNCQCECGKTKEVREDHLFDGGTMSCGCLLREVAVITNTKHGLSRSRLYKTLRGMIQRCYNPDKDNYAWYGGMGITICDEWLGEDGFINFATWSYANGYTDELTIDRIDSNGNYGPENCRWVTVDQQQNNKSSNRIINHKDLSYTVSQLARVTNIPYGSLIYQLNQNGNDNNISSILENFNTKISVIKFDKPKSTVISFGKERI